MALENHPMWRRPQHHFDLDNPSEHVHWVELFYDLIHVVTIFLLGNYLSDHHVSGHSLLVFTALFVALYYAWGELSVFNSIFVSTDVWHRLTMAAMICTVMFMAASIPAIEGKGWAYFAMGFAVNRLLMAALYRRARRVGADVDGSPFCNEMTRNFLILAALYGIAAFLPRPLAYWVFAAAVVFMHVIYWIPPLSPLRFERFAPRISHMAERFALLTLIVLGEGFFKLVVTLSEKGIYKVGADVLVNFVIGGVSVFVMCWIYFDFVGNGKPKDDRMPTLIGWWLGHMFLMLGGVLVGVALAGEVKVGLLEPFPLEYARAGCLGLLIYLVSLWVIQQTVERREAHRFATTDIRVVGIVLVGITYLVVPYVPAIVGNLLWGSALFSQIVVPLIRAVKTLRAEEQVA